MCSSLFLLTTHFSHALLADVIFALGMHAGSRLSLMSSNSLQRQRHFV